jgi:two-component system CheB/CheR fusion protein
VNEELVTVNAELQAKIDQQARTENDMKSLLDSINIGTLFLDTGLNIKRYTAMATKLFNLIPTDVGRPIDDIRSNLKYDALTADAQGVLETLRSAEKELETKAGDRYLTRMMPSRTQENLIDGLVITFTDISQHGRPAEGLSPAPKKGDDHRRR